MKTPLSPRVLVVDDEPTVLRLTKCLLELKGYQVLTAPDAEEGLRICKELDGELALVISDISMPGMNGRELARCVAELPNPVPVILMSGYSSTSPLLEGLNDGSVDDVHFHFLRKPFRRYEFLRLAEEAIESFNSK
jgi:two-component system, cell cycle sensor histidine kinase and response regulator CckA